MTHSGLVDGGIYFSKGYLQTGRLRTEKNSSILRRRENGKRIALLFVRNKRVCVHLKCGPQKAGFRRSVYVGVQPGRHMNKRHWNTVDLQCECRTGSCMKCLQTACK